MAQLYVDSSLGTQLYFSLSKLLILEHDQVRAGNQCKMSVYFCDYLYVEYQ